jgi:uncharacterized protein (TIGR00725 family)
MNTESSSRPIISIYGSSTSPPDNDDYAAALRLGQMIGKGGGSVATGGYGGVMEAASRGAVENGGRAIGYTVQGWTTRKPNKYLSSNRPCADLYDRLRHLVEGSNALVTLDGGIGTLAELAVAWNHLYLKLVLQRPLIIVGDGWKHALVGMRGMLELSDAHMELVEFAANVDAAVESLRSKGILE